MQRAPSRIEPAVFWTSAAIAAAVIAFRLAAPELARGIFLGAQGWIVSRLAWLFVGATALFLLVALGAALSPAGRLRLGPEGEGPAFSRASWFAMLFSAGMGIGIMFYGVAEPVLHYASPPEGAGGNAAAAQRAMTLTFFHWGLHAWGVYAVMGLAIAFHAHRLGLPMAVRSTLHPLLGRRIHGPLGHAVDVLAVLGTLFGLATSLGLGALQINAGLTRLVGAPESVWVQVGLVALITAGATTSVVLGLDRGIRRLSELNMVLATLLLTFVLFAGPTGELLRTLPAHAWRYAVELVPLSLFSKGLGDDAWRGSWTIFYWAWWIAWAPFVGTFIARISRGRTVREFVVGVLFVPTAMSIVWFTVFGWTAIQLDLAEPGVAAAVQAELATGVYAMLERLPWAGLTSALAALVVTIFFITSSDSGSFVVDMLTSGGHPHPPVRQRIFWAITEGVIAAVLLVGGGLVALQSAAIDTGLPFCLVLVAVCVGLVKALWRETRSSAVREAPDGA